MEIYILDRDVQILGVVTVYDAIVWKSKLNEPGTFKASFLFSEEMNCLLKRGRLLYKTDEEEPAVITRKYLKLDKTGAETIQVQGYMASRYLNQRIIWSRMILKGTSEEIMRRMVEEQVIHPADEKRAMNRIRLGELCGCEDEVEKQVAYDNLQEALSDVAKAAELGYRLRLDVKERLFFFEVYQGMDRTLGTKEPCIFSRDFRNVYTQEYSEDDSNRRNICLVGGAGEEEERVLTTVGDGEGLDRYELFYGASGISSSDLTEEEYRSQLSQKGDERLAKCGAARSFESKVNQTEAMTFSLGDRVTCVDQRWDVRMDAQITGIEKGFSKTEKSLTVTFGNAVPTLIDLIKNMK